MNTAPNILSRRSILAKPARNHLQTTRSNIERIQLELILANGHVACVNCLEWSQSGQLLASGSDDQKVVIWQPFQRDLIRYVINTGHTGNIFSVKFMPNSCDSLIATCAYDHEVRLIDCVSNELRLNCANCHQDRVKRLATHPNEPNLLWSAGEDGYIMQYDIREKHTCSRLTPNNLLLDLKMTSQIKPIAKCLALDPFKDEVIAIGANDSYVRLFDRRYLNKKDIWSSCIKFFEPGHMATTTLDDDYRRDNFTRPLFHLKTSCGATYLAYNPSNSGELLVNIRGEQIYLFNTNKPYETGYKSFTQTIKPLVYDFPIKNENKGSYSRWKKMREQCKRVDLPKEHLEFYRNSIKKCEHEDGKLSLSELNKINSLLTPSKGGLQNCVELYHLRAAAMIQRGWRGDYYQAIRDCCCGLALNPLDYYSLANLMKSFKYLEDNGAFSEVKALLELIERHLESDSSNPEEVIKEHLDSDECHYFGLDENEPIFEDIEDIEHNETYENIFHRIQEEDVRFIREISNSMQNNQNIYQPMDVCGTKACDFDSNMKMMKKFELEACDYDKRYCGHCNINTDIKEANFFGSNGNFIVAGSDDGAFYIWDKETTNLIKAAHGDHQILNAIQPHPEICMLATSGIESTVKLWSPIGKTNTDVKCLEQRCIQNQSFVANDPWEAMIMMLYSENI